jgi:hypothetical protein
MAEMKLRLLVHTCSNEHVSRAAVLSIGGDLAARSAAEAARRGCSVGGLIVEALQEFERSSDLVTWGQVELVTRGSDQPILAALYFILDRALARTGEVSMGAPIPLQAIN